MRHSVRLWQGSSWRALYDTDSDMETESFDIEAFSAAVLKRGEPIQPNPADVAAYHGEGKYLQQFREKYEQIIADL